MSSSEIVIERDGAIAWLALNRPDQLNAMNPSMLRRFGETVDELGADKSVRVVIVRGAGRAFSSGYDLKRADAQGDAAYGEEHSPVDDYERLLGNIKLFEKLWDLSKPVIAAVHGYCLAGATQLCTFCDITVVADDAKIGWPAMPFGGGLISPMWSFLVGPKRAKQMSFVAGSEISGTTASEWGWANYAVPEAELWENVAALAREIAKVPAEVLRMKKHSINRVSEIQGFRSAMTMGAETDALLHFSPSVIEQIRSLRENGLKEASRRYHQTGDE